MTDVTLLSDCQGFQSTTDLIDRREVREMCSKGKTIETISLRATSLLKLKDLSSPQSFSGLMEHNKIKLESTDQHLHDETHCFIGNQSLDFSHFQNSEPILSPWEQQ